MYHKNMYHKKGKALHCEALPFSFENKGKSDSPMSAGEADFYGK
jgi:hypothetical protein